MNLRKQEQYPSSIAVSMLGKMAYEDVWKIQQDFLRKRINNEISDTLLVVEHPHVITMGRKYSVAMPELKETVREWQGVPVYFVERGGEATYHGPGQLVMYPIFLLPKSSGPTHFLRLLEHSILLSLARYNIAAFRKEGATGVWVFDSFGKERKIASLGIALRHFVTYHGLALNISTDLSYFQKIIPCGFSPNIMTNMEEILGAEKLPDSQSITTNLIADLCNSFCEEKNILGGDLSRVGIGNLL